MSSVKPNEAGEVAGTQEKMERQRTNIIRVELIDTHQHTGRDHTEGPLCDRTHDWKLALVDIIDQ